MIQKDDYHVLLFVLFLYMILCPHSLHRIGSRDLISFLTPQSVVAELVQDCETKNLATNQHKDTPYPVSEEGQNPRSDLKPD